MRLITTCLIIYQAFTNGAKIQTLKKPQPTLPKKINSAPINLAKVKQETTQTTSSTSESIEEQCYNEVFGIYTDSAIINNPSGMVIEYSNGFCSDNADAVEKSIVPYYCFYTGYNLLYQIQLSWDRIERLSGDSEPNTQTKFDAKTETIDRFCDDFKYGAQERTLFLEDFYHIPDQELAESDCAEYLAVDFDYTKSEFDPIDMTDKLENEIICAQEYAMIQALRQNDFTELTDTVRFSYTVSLESGNEAFQVLDYGRCTEEDSSSNPEEFCLNFYNWNVNFSMWSQLQTEKVCQRISESLKSREHVTTDSCAFITSRVYQLYSWYLQDISDSIISEQISTLNDEYQKEVDMFRAEGASGESQQLDDVNQFIGDLYDDPTVQERQEEEDLEELQDQADDVQVFIDDVAELEDEQEQQELDDLEQQAAEVEELLDEIKVLENEQKIEEQKAKLKKDKEAQKEAEEEYKALEAQAAEVQALLDDIKALEDQNKQTEEQTQINDQKNQAQEVDEFIEDVEEQEDIQDQAELEEQEAQLEAEEDLVELQAKANEVQAFIDEVAVLEEELKAQNATEQEQQELQELEKQAQNVQKFIDEVKMLEDSGNKTDQMELLRLELKAAQVDKFIDDVKELEEEQEQQEKLEAADTASDAEDKKQLTDTATKAKDKKYLMDLQAQADDVQEFIDYVAELEDEQEQEPAPQLVKVTNTAHLHQPQHQQTLPWGTNTQQQQQQQQLVQQSSTASTMPVNTPMQAAQPVPMPNNMYANSNIAVQLPQTYMQQQQPQQFVYQQAQPQQPGNVVYVQSIPQTQTAQPVLQVQQPQQAVYSTVQLPQYRY